MLYIYIYIYIERERDIHMYQHRCGSGRNADALSTKAQEHKSPGAQEPWHKSQRAQGRTIPYNYSIGQGFEYSFGRGPTVLQ